MKKNNLFILTFITLNLFVSCATTAEMVTKDSSFFLKEDEGLIFLRILNPNAGETIDDFFYSNGNTVRNQEPLYLNSDLQIKKAPGSFSVFTVANTETPEQIVMLKAKKGSYGIIKVGENSEYFNPYVFNVEAGVINYAGDIKLDVITGRILIWHKVKDYYDFSVIDNFYEILGQRESVELLSLYSDYEFINQSKNIKPMQPLNCHVIRDN